MSQFIKIYNDNPNPKEIAKTYVTYCLDELKKPDIPVFEKSGHIKDALKMKQSVALLCC